MFIRWRKWQGKKQRYACLYEAQHRPGKAPLMKYVAYLGKNPEAKLRKLLQEGKLTPEQVAKISSPEVASLVEEVKRQLASTWCEKAKDYCPLKALAYNEKEVLNNG